jgi:hypothetical protein
LLLFLLILELAFQNGETALHVAARKGHVEVINQLLSSYRTDVDLTDKVCLSDSSSNAKFIHVSRNN